MQHEQSYRDFLERNPYPRELKNIEIISGIPSSIIIKKNGKNLLNFSGNDYLGLAHHPLLIARAKEYTEKYGTGSSSSRLVAGNFHLYEQLETQLAKALGKECALILGTGFQTNSSILSALCDQRILGEIPLVFCDRLCHASMLGLAEGTRLQRFQHNNYNHLARLLEKYAQATQPKFILAESIYSMEGDQSDLAALTALAKTHNAFLYIDDAHAVGAYGTKGWGLAPEWAAEIDVIMGTFSKGLGSFGGYIGCSKTIREYLINSCKGLIYSTGLPPGILGAISAAIELVPSLGDERHRLANYQKILQSFLKEQDLEYGLSNTHIIPWIIGDAKKSLYISDLLEKEGILATTIRPPSVAVGKSRIRFCLSAAHTDEHLEKLMLTIKKIVKMAYE